jgi:hypothetical protein
MKNGKYLGKDGLPCEFYKGMWDMIGDDFCHLVVKVFTFHRFSESLNLGSIKLNSKNVARDTIGGWKPITILNVE